MRSQNATLLHKRTCKARVGLKLRVGSMRWWRLEGPYGLFVVLCKALWKWERRSECGVLDWWRRWRRKLRRLAHTSTVARATVYFGTPSSIPLASSWRMMRQKYWYCLTCRVSWQALAADTAAYATSSDIFVAFYQAVNGPTAFNCYTTKLSIRRRRSEYR